MKLSRLTLMMAVPAVAVVLACGENATENTASESVNEQAASESQNAEAESMTASVDVDKSNVQWKGTMLGMYDHSGTVSIKQGSMEVSGGMVNGGEIVVDLTSMTPTDENYDPSKDQTKEKLVGHLSSPDFFDVATYPTATFVISGMEGNSLNGELTIRGITKQESVENVMYDEESKTWSGKLVFDRKQFDVAWDSPMKEMVLSDDIELDINISI